MTKQLTATHPLSTQITITYDPLSWSYSDTLNARYMFATRFVKRFFPAFDAPAAAARVSARTGQPIPEIIAAWKAKGKASSLYGDHVHAYAAARIDDTITPAPASEQEQSAFRVVDAALDMLSSAYDFHGAEILVFDPVFLLAGYLDLAATNRETGAMTVVDWKTNEAISDDAWGRTALDPIASVPDSKLMHYAMDQSVYGSILESGYLAADQPLELALVHIPPGATEPEWIELPYLRAEVEACRDAWRATPEWLELSAGKEKPGEADPTGQNSE